MTVKPIFLHERLSSNNPLLRKSMPWATAPPAESAGVSWTATRMIEAVTGLSVATGHAA